MKPVPLNLNSTHLWQARREKAVYESMSAYADAVTKLNQHAVLQGMASLLPLPAAFIEHITSQQQQSSVSPPVSAPEEKE